MIPWLLLALGESTASAFGAHGIANTFALNPVGTGVFMATRDTNKYQHYLSPIKNRHCGGLVDADVWNLSGCYGVIDCVVVILSDSYLVILVLNHRLYGLIALLI